MTEIFPPLSTSMTLQLCCQEVMSAEASQQETQYMAIYLLCLCCCVPGSVHRASRAQVIPQGQAACQPWHLWVFLHVLEVLTAQLSWAIALNILHCR